MNVWEPDAGQTVAHAVIDGDGRLLSAEPALEALNARAGGATGDPLAVPQLATAARLARRLGIVVSRPVTVADEEADVELWVRAQPDGTQVRLAVSGWREAPAWRPAPPPAGEPDADWRWETDAALRLTFLSLDGAARAGVDPFGLLGAPLTQLFALDHDDAGALPILDALARRRGFADQRAQVRATRRAVILSAEVRRTDVGDFAGLTGCARSVDPPAAASDQPALPPSFTGGLDRALRRPLARIVANADSIHAQADGPIAPDYADYAADIANAGRHLLELVDDLVDLQAIERPDFRLTAAPIDLADVARRAAGLLGVRASQAEVTIERPAPEIACPARGDFRRALQIAVNLTGNALRYSPKGEVVTLATGTVDGRAVLTVADRGKGVAPADQARIFDKFERVDPGEVGGNGLGLYISRRLARAMAGDLTVESAPGAGARFTLTLPAE
ncbi:sensor histidine kinase [uncultured Sphingomonas sp.]|uniref:sensor histidine kinase n=1 Tax=uncultured Sphingomonas sp. TaxID=158754 RepID=UPI0035CA7006